MSEAGLLRAMVRNYSRNNLWDHLDAEACTKAANKIDELTEKLIEQAAEIESLRISYDSACRLVAQLHEAVMGEIVGPHHGVVEDVRNKVAWLEATLASEQQDYKEVEAMLHAERDSSQALRNKVIELEAWNDKIGCTNYGLRQKIAEQAAAIEKLIPAIRFDSLNMSLTEWRDVCKVAEVARTDSKQILADWMREQLGEPINKIIHYDVVGLGHDIYLSQTLYKLPECLK